MRKEIPLFKVFMSEDIDGPLLETLHSGFVGQGERVEEFEASLRDYLNHGYITTVNSGTSALQLAIHLLKDPYHPTNWPGIDYGDEVLTACLTCSATFTSILANDLNVKWVDVDPDNYNIDLDDLARKITPKTKIILPVLWGGYPLDLERVQEIQNRARDIVGFKPALIEDAAHALGAEYKGKKIGNHGHISCFSLQAIKTITSIDGGFVSWPHNELYKKARLARWFGLSRDDSRHDLRCVQNIKLKGFKYHMNDIAAVVGNENLKHLKRLISINRHNAAYYDETLGLLSHVKNPESKHGHRSSYWLYTIQVERRDDFQKHMKSKGIATSPVHLRCDTHDVVKDFKSMLPNMDRIEKNYVCIPVNWWVTEEDREFIVDSIKEGW